MKKRTHLNGSKGVELAFPPGIAKRDLMHELEALAHRVRVTAFYEEGTDEELIHFFEDEQAVSHRLSSELLLPADVQIFVRANVPPDRVLRILSIVAGQIAFNNRLPELSIQKDNRDDVDDLPF